MSPWRKDVLIAPTVASSARPAAAFEMSAWRAMASIISDLFTEHPFYSNLPAMRRREAAASDVGSAHERRRARCCDFIALAFSRCQGLRDARASSSAARHKQKTAGTVAPAVDDCAKMGQCLITALLSSSAAAAGGTEGAGLSVSSTIGAGCRLSV